MIIPGLSTSRRLVLRYPEFTAGFLMSKRNRLLLDFAIFCVGMLAGQAMTTQPGIGTILGDVMWVVVFGLAVTALVAILYDFSKKRKVELLSEGRSFAREKLIQDPSSQTHTGQTGQSP